MQGGVEKMIGGIGVDMIEVQRVMEKISRSPDFKQYVFSENEIIYCEEKAHKYEHYAARFAAKEALLKALGIGIFSYPNLNDIEIINDDTNKPYFNFNGEFDLLIKSRNISQIHLSMTHLKDVACAMVVIELL